MPLTPDHDPAESGVHFHADHPSFVFEHIAERSAWIAHCIDHHDCELGRINIVAVTDETLHAINIEFLDHDVVLLENGFSGGRGKRTGKRMPYAPKRSRIGSS